MMSINGSPGPLWTGGPIPGQFYNFPGGKSDSNNTQRVRSVNPIVTGTSVLAVQFKGGVVIAADTLGSYGSLAKYRDLKRLLKVNDTTVIGAAGDYADFQYMSNIIQQQVINDEVINDGFGYTPKSVHCLLTRILYNRRSQFNPLWNTYIIAGIEEDQPYLGYVDKIGMAYEAPSLACGFGAYVALPIIRDALEKKPDISKDEAVALIDRCMKLMYYRDARALNKYQLAVITKDGVDIKGPIISETNWEVAHMIRGYE
ncbi:Proteasome subunit beta type-4 [Biomphalaria glabrata]|uniref:Proteasome subunit beta n=2 Tax=Biomphalaria TaxID=6525 RepID=A0A9W2ZEQ8_BIOGL|nr:proteasome subunit beta type-4-like [Biomphalaria glabrata]KAI8752294.1 proteasome subunit beta type-4 [Biomphalaria glabrata]KAK0067908.1 proteasome subunit beta type-4 [Biomphalaria pfeifferi]